MPSKESVLRQRAWGGAIGVAVLGLALVYHFFPRVFHVDPEQVQPRRSMNMGPLATAPSAGASGPAVMAPASEVDAGPPLTLAPTEVIAARMSARNTQLPQQMSADTPQIQALLVQAGKALRAGQLVGDTNSAAALYQEALKQKPDSRRAAQGLFEVKARLVAAIDQDVAVGDADGASDLLDALKTLPDASDDVANLEQKLKVLNQVRPLLAQAANLLQQGKADQPADGNALAVYRQVLQLDPDNAVAQQGLLQVQRVVLDRALAAVAQNDFKGADQALAEASGVQPDSPQLRDVQGRVDGMRKQRGSSLLIQARSALDSGNLTLAEQLAGQAQAVGADQASLKDFTERVTNARLYASYKPGQAFTDRFNDMPGQAPAMVVVPTGNLMMGAGDNEDGRNDNEVPQHPVALNKGFAMARTDVTVAQFRDFVRATGYVPDSQRLGGASVYDERSGAMRDDEHATWQSDYAGRSADDKQPVVNISWNDARAYTEWLSQHTGKTYRLPSEAEFEYAMRGGTSSRYWWGDASPKSKVENLTGAGDRSSNGRRWSNAFAGYRDGYWGPAPVMSFAPNPFGLYDINGNVSEWVQDCWHDSYLRAPRDGSPWINPGCGTRVIRGGSWGSSPDQARSAYRQGADASVRSGRVGFRVVREL